MAQLIGRLNALTVSRAKTPGMYPDGGGMYLQVSANGARSWVYRFMLHGKARYMGLGPLHTVSLADARRNAQAARLLRHEGIDPIEERKAARTKARLDAANAITFRDAADRYIKSNQIAWSNPKHRAQWKSSLEAHVHRVFGSMSVQAVDTGLVLRAIEPIWAEKPETAGRVRGRIERILDWATTRGYRTGENPARWWGHLQNTLPKRSKVQRVRHHPALPYDRMSTFMEKLRGQDGTAAKALEFLILTGARTSEIIGAVWREFDLDDAIWVIPAERIKARREHRVPLSQAALSALKSMRADHEPAPDDPVFPGGRKGRPLSNMAMLALLKRMKHDELTVHGFRSTFRDWAAERTNFPREVAEAALAHAVPDKVEAAYRRGDFFGKRRQMMEAWAKFYATAPTKGEVVAMRKRKE